MDIGKKIQSARINANLTQEKAAQALNISRQTISNWENEKTYPDIISVIKMSDLYSVSLDYLLKGENSMSNYLDYLEESTNAVTGKRRFAKEIVIVVYLLIWSIAVIAFWFFAGASDAMGYGLIYLYILLPTATIILSIIIGRNNYWGKMKWISAIAFGLMYMLAQYATFSAANMVSFSKINVPDFGMIFVGAIVSFIGLGIGCAIRLAKLKKRKNVCD